MLLQALYELDRRERLRSDCPDYEPKRVAWLVRIDVAGRYLGTIGTHYAVPSPDGKKKPRELIKYYLVPREPERTSGDFAFFLCDKAEYVFGVEPDGKEGGKGRSAEKLCKRAQLFQKKIHDCYAATGDEGAKAVLDFLTAKAFPALPSGCKSNDLFAFVCDIDGEALVSDRKKIREYWKSVRDAQLHKEATAICIVKNEKCVPVDKHPGIKVPGGSTSGIALISFNSPAFESYGREGNDNAPMSRDASEGCATALRRLLYADYPSPHELNMPMARRSLRISDDTIVCFWSAKQSGDEFCSAFGGLLEANPETVKALYQSAWRGRIPEISDPSAFYALTLTGSQGRAIVRDWFESTVEGVARNLAAHFSDLEIVRNSPKVKDSEFAPQLPLSLLLKALGTSGDNSKAPAPLIGKLLHSALHATPYPISILQKAIERERAEISNHAKEGLDKYHAFERSDARAALIKAVLNRRKRLFPKTTTYMEVKKTMDPNTTSEGYSLGCLMAVLERLQQEAVGDVNASVVDRFFSGASASPKSVFIRLLKSARCHVNKAIDVQDRRGFVFRLDRLVDELACCFDPKRNGFPSYLDLDQQGLFILGYHQMRKWLWMPREERVVWENKHPDAPRAYLWTARSEEK